MKIIRIKNVLQYVEGETFQEKLGDIVETYYNTISPFFLGAIAIQSMIYEYIIIFFLCLICLLFFQCFRISIVTQVVKKE